MSTALTLPRRSLLSRSAPFLPFSLSLPLPFFTFLSFRSFFFSLSAPPSASYSSLTRAYTHARAFLSAFVPFFDFSFFLRQRVNYRLTSNSSRCTRSSLRFAIIIAVFPRFRVRFGFSRFLEIPLVPRLRPVSVFRTVHTRYPLRSTNWIIIAAMPGNGWPENGPRPSPGS